MKASELITYLHPYERQILPILDKSSSVEEITKISKLQEVEVMRALQWLSNKNVVKIHTQDYDVLSITPKSQSYVKDGLPETQFLKAIEKKGLTFQDMQKKINKEEFNVCLGMLKKEKAIEIDKGIINITKLGEKILSTPNDLHAVLNSIQKEDKLTKKELELSKELIKRGLVKSTVRSNKSATLEKLGKDLLKEDLSKADQLEEKLTSQMLKDGSWENKTFRKYDVNTKVPSKNRGKRHFVNEAIEYAREVWLSMGFQEMTGDMVNTSYWNFDTLFTAQDHPVRDMQDTFFIGKPVTGKLPKDVSAIKAVHENGGDTQSVGWKYSWSEDDARTNVLRTHTTVLSSKTLSNLNPEDLPAKFFAVGKCFRNETVDWSHLFEFNQSEGIVIDEDVNFRHLLGYLKRFFALLGFPQARFRPAYFPYTEPSVEIDVFHPVHKKWFELGGAGIFRPEVTKPLLGKEIPVLAWGPGFDRIMTEYYEIKDLRDLYKNDLKQLREMKSWMR